MKCINTECQYHKHYTTNGCDIWGDDEIEEYCKKYQPEAQAEQEAEEYTAENDECVAYQDKQKETVCCLCGDTGKIPKPEIENEIDPAGQQEEPKQTPPAEEWNPIKAKAYRYASGALCGGNFINVINHNADGIQQALARITAIENKLSTFRDMITGNARVIGEYKGLLDVRIAELERQIKEAKKEAGKYKEPKIYGGSDIGLPTKQIKEK